MSQFEFVSVAVALIYAVAVGRLLSDLPTVFEPRLRYWVHAGWVVYLLFYSAVSWWNFYVAAQDLEFNPATFLFALSIPSLVVVRANLLLGPPAGRPDSYRRHFYEKRRPFFAVGLLSMGMLLVVPWVIGALGPEQTGQTSLRTLPFLLIWLTGLLSDRPRVHAILISIMLPLLVFAFLASSMIDG